MRPKTMILAATALGLFTALPSMATAQDAPPVTVRIVDPPVDTPPPPGTSYIRFGPHEIEVNSPIGMTSGLPGLPKSSAVLIMPDGAPPLPADLFDTVPLAGSGIGYVAKSQDRVVVLYQGKPNTSPIPGQFQSIIEASTDTPQTKVGLIHKGEAVISVPYHYKKPIRMTDDLNITGLFGTHALATKGEVGFDAGEYNGAGVRRHLLCFFNASHSKPYVAPDCFVKFPSPDGTFSLGEVVVLNNVPTSFTSSRYMVSGVKAPPVDTTDVKIDHDFHLDLVVNWWSDSSVELSWRSDGRPLLTEKAPIGKDGFVKLRVKGGSIVMRGDPAEPTQSFAEFVPDAAPAAAPVPKP